MKTRRVFSIVLSMLFLSACGNATTQPLQQETSVEMTDTMIETEDTTDSGSEAIADNTEADKNNEKSIVVYFDYSENIDTTGLDVDAISSASLRGGSNGKNIENLKVMVDEIVRIEGSDVFSIQVNEVYPADFEEMTGIARDDIANGKAFTFKNELPDLTEYDTVYFGVPVWWGELPQPVHVFFQENDFSGKMIVPFGIHHGSRFGRMAIQMGEYEPDATILDGFTIDADTDNEDVRAGIAEYITSIDND